MKISSDFFIYVQIKIIQISCTYQHGEKRLSALSNNVHKNISQHM